MDVFATKIRGFWRSGYFLLLVFFFLQGTGLPQAFSKPEQYLLKQLADIISLILSSSSICKTNFRDYEYIIS